MLQTQCPTEQNIQRFLLGLLPLDATEVLEQHLLSCEVCVKTAHALKTSDTLVDALQTLPPDDEEDKKVVKRLVTTLLALAHLPESEQKTAAQTPSRTPSQIDLPVGFLGPPEEEDDIGTLGGYRVLRILGTGGMGMVFEAEDVRLHRRVALKVMRPELSVNELHRQRFLREARATAAIEHENIVDIYQVGEDRGVVFLAMPLLRGQTLDDYLTNGGQVSLQMLLSVGIQTAKGLAAAHKKNLVHRDIKPSNLWIEPDGRVKIVDFGLARSTGSDRTRITQSDAILGTPAYMAPEQTRSKSIDHRCDLFSLGCVLYELATGELPFQGEDTMSVIASLALDTPAAPRAINAGLPQPLSDLIMRMLSKAPQHRPDNARDVVDALQHIKQDVAGSTVTLSRGERSNPIVDSCATTVVKRTGSNRASYALLGGVVVALLIFFLVWGPAFLVARIGHGTVVIRTNDPDIEVTIRRNGEKLVQQKLDQPETTTKLPVGDIEVSLKNKQDNVLIRNGEFSLDHNDTVVVTIERQVATKHPANQRNQSISDKEDGRLRTPRSIVPAEAPPEAACEIIASGSWDQTIKLWNADTGKELRTLRGHEGNITALAFSPDGRLLASTSTDKSARVWDVRTGKCLQLLYSDTDHFTGVAFSPDSKRLATGGWNKKVIVWDFRKEQRLRTLSGHTGKVSSVTFSPDGKKIASSGGFGDMTIKIWDADTGKMLRTLRGHRNHVTAATFSPNGERLASASFDCTAKLWDVESGTELVTLKDHIGGVFAVAFDRKGKQLVTGGADRILRIWNAENGELRHKLPGHEQKITAAEFGDNGLHVVSGSFDKKVNMWDVQTGRVLRTLEGHTDLVRCLAITTARIKTDPHRPSGKRPGNPHGLPGR